MVAVFLCHSKKNEFENYYNNPIINKNKPQLKNAKKEFSTARLIISIIMLILSVIVLFQSCAAGVVNIIEDNGNADGGIGLLVFLCMIIFGIIGIVTKNTKSHICLLLLATFSTIIFFLCVFVYNGIFEDLKVWGWLFGIYALIFAFSGNAVRYNKIY